MPRLLSLLACEKAILDKQDVPTLVSVMSAVVAQLVPRVPGEQPPIPPDAMAPKPWTVFTTWDLDAEETGKTFHQKLEVIMPDQSVFELIKSDLPFVAKGGLNNNYINIMGFPVGIEGVWKVKVWLESADGQVLVPETYYPIKVEYGIVIPQEDRPKISPASRVSSDID